MDEKNECASCKSFENFASTNKSRQYIRRISVHLCEAALKCETSVGVCHGSMTRVELRVYLDIARKL